MSEPPLDTSLYNLHGEGLDFFKTQTGIHNDEELRKHILDIQAEAYSVLPYPCIRNLGFTKLRISRHPMYNTALKIGRERHDAILLDLGCCFGNDVRKAIADGYPLENVIATDINPEFWSLGHKLFKSSEESFPVPLIIGDIFDPKFLAPDTSPAPSSPMTQIPAPKLSLVTSLTQLQHHVSVIHVSALFHLFDEEEQRTLAHLIGSLLSPLPGSLIFGGHVGVPEKDESPDDNALLKRDYISFEHSRSTWERLWVGEGGVFNSGEVLFSTETVEDVGIYGNPVPGYRTYLALFWSITRA